MLHRVLVDDDDNMKMNLVIFSIGN